MRELVVVLLLLVACAVYAQNQPAPAAPTPATTPATPAAPAVEAPAAPVNPLRLVMPPEVPAVAGHEINIYFDNLILTPRSDLYLYDVDCAKGTQQTERYTWVPKPEEVGVYPLSLKVYDLQEKLVAEGTTKVHVYPADAGAGTEATLLIVGDSLTHGNVYPAEVFDLCNKAEGNPKLTLIGSFAPNKTRPEVKHEGYGGWAAATFTSKWSADIWTPENRRGRSPFLYEQDGKHGLDFQKFCDEQNAGKGPDYITILLGCNDNFGAKDDTIEKSIDSFLANMEVLLKEFHRVRPDTKIGIVTLLPPSASQDAFGAPGNYGCGQTRWQYRKNQHRVLEREYATFSGREAENVFIVPAYVNLDCVHNVITQKVAVNARNPEIVVRQANGVHPDGTGYRQLADSIYNWLKGTMAAGK